MHVIFGFLRIFEVGDNRCDTFRIQPRGCIRFVFSRAEWIVRGHLMEHCANNSLLTFQLMSLNYLIDYQNVRISNIVRSVIEHVREPEAATKGTA